MPACDRPNGFKASFIQNLLLKDLDKPLRDNQLNLELVLKLEMLLLHVESMLPKHIAFDAKRIIKWTPNRCPNLSNTLVKPGSEKIMKIIKNHILLLCKICNFI